MHEARVHPRCVVLGRGATTLLGAGGPKRPGLGERERGEQPGGSWGERGTARQMVQEQRRMMHPQLLCGLGVYPARRESRSQPAWVTPRQHPAQQAGAGSREEPRP